MNQKQKEWKISYCRPELPEELLQSGFPPLLAAVLAQRGVRSCKAAAELFFGDEVLYDPMLMTGMATAVERIRQAIARGETVAVYGDYDVDGITSTCLLTDYLRSKGLRCLPYIPDRNEEGYGLNDGAVDALRARGASLLITVDCGITALAEVDHAARIGLEVIITDHHECGHGQLPRAVAVIDCKQDGDPYPNKDLAGVGVALKLACACEGDSGKVLEQYADLVAVGTVADVMPLVGENRSLVRRGLKKLGTSPRPGIAAMMRESSIDASKLTASTIGFSLAPRLNAAGRLGQAETAAELLMTTDPRAATELAVELCELNRQRQNIETEIWHEANAQLSGTVPDAPIVLASDRWHQGVIGIAASRLAEQYSLPAIMICLNGDTGKGSCRSFGGFNLFEALNACSEHLMGFGGHALAAGLNIKLDKLNDFRAALARYYRANKPAALPEVQCDLLINDPALLSIDNVRALDRLEPYGNANPRPMMCVCGVRLEALSEVGSGRHLRMRIRLRSEHFEAIFFSHTAKELGLREGGLVDLAFTPQINEFRGRVSVQLVVCAARRHDGRELCKGILENRQDMLWAAAEFCPDRADFVRVWRMIQHQDLSVGDTAEAVLAQCPEGMEPERFCICLAVFLETGLLSSPGGSVYGAREAHIEGKADLESTEIIRLLRTC